MGTPPSSAAEPEALRCVLTAPAQATAGQAVLLQFTLTNTGKVDLQVLNWNTPLEGWFGRYVDVSYNGAELPYRGPTFKRGDPAKANYLALGAGKSLTASVDLALPFDLTQAGHYRIEPHITLFDVVAKGQSAIPRLRDQHQPRSLACNAVALDVVTGTGK